MTLVWSEYFRRSFKRLVRKTPAMQESILTTLEYLAQDPFNPTLKTHKLGGHLRDLWACSVEYIAELLLSFKK